MNVIAPMIVKAGVTESHVKCDSPRHWLMRCRSMAASPIPTDWTSCCAIEEVVEARLMRSWSMSA